MRNLIYAFDRSFEGAIGALGAPLVGMAAERWFGFTGVAGGDEACAEHSTANMGERAAHASMHHVACCRQAAYRYVCTMEVPAQHGRPMLADD